MVKVKNHRKGGLNLRFGVKLSPGENDVDPEAWEHCRRDPITLHYLQAHDIEVIVTHSQAPTAKTSAASTPVAAEVEAPIDDNEEDTQENPAPTPEEPVSEDADERPANVPISKMRAKDVITMVESTDEVMTLKSMLMTEERPTVRAAIEHRLQELKE